MNRIATEGLSPRAYNSPVMYKGSFDLLPDEQPRSPFSMPEDNTCPKCGRKNGNIRRETYFRCFTCCAIIELPGPEALPITPDMLIPEQVSGSLVNAVCDECGKHFVKKVSNKSPYCQRCRSNKQSTEWREKHPHQYKTTQRKHQAIIREKQARRKELAKDFL